MQHFSIRSQPVTGRAHLRVWRPWAAPWDWALIQNFERDPQRLTRWHRANVVATRELGPKQVRGRENRRQWNSRLWGGPVRATKRLVELLHTHQAKARVALRKGLAVTFPGRVIIRYKLRCRREPFRHNIRIPVLISGRCAFVP